MAGRKYVGSYEFQRKSGDFFLGYCGEHTLMLPAEAQILGVSTNENRPCVKALVVEGAELQRRRFRIVQDLKEGAQIGTENAVGAILIPTSLYIGEISMHWGFTGLHVFYSVRTE